MEVVELKVQVEKSQLAALEKDIKALQSKRIKISVDASGFDALSKSTKSAAQSVQAYGSAVSQAQGSGTKLTQAQQKAAAATEKTAAAYTKAAQSAGKAQSAQAQYASQAEKSASATSKAAAQTEKMSKSASLLGDSLGNVAVKMAAWQVMGDLVATPIRALKEALDTMKAVDDQLVDVRKVTGFTETQMKALEEQSYATASAYGEAADEYLASVAEFARAGYGEQAEALAELYAMTGAMEQAVDVYLENGLQNVENCSFFRWVEENGLVKHVKDKALQLFRLNVQQASVLLVEHMNEVNVWTGGRIEA